MDHSVYKIDSIPKSFSALHVLKSVTLEIQSGSIVVCIGANGAGKTTFFKILCGLFRKQIVVVFIKKQQNYHSHQVLI